MVKLFTLLFFTIPIFANLQYLSKTLEPETLFEGVSTEWVEDVHSSGVATDDGIDVDVPLGFSFSFNGTSYTEVDIDSNGYLVFGNDSKSVYTNEALPQSDKSQSIYPYWDDLNVAKGGTIRYGTLGSGENIHFIVSWENVPQFPSTGAYSLQVILYKNGSIRFRYDATSSIDGASGTVGVQENVNNYDQHVYNSSTTFDATKDILYTYLSAKLSIVKDSCVVSDSINGTNNPKRIPMSVLRYAIEVSNRGTLSASDVIVTDDISVIFDEDSINNIQIQSGVCDCLGVTSTSNNGVNGTTNGINPIILDFGNILGGSVATPTIECGYFEVLLK